MIYYVVGSIAVGIVVVLGSSIVITYLRLAKAITGSYKRIPSRR